MSLTKDDRQFIADLIEVVLKYPTQGYCPAAQDEIDSAMQRADEREQKAVAAMYGTKQ